MPERRPVRHLILLVDEAAESASRFAAIVAELGGEDDQPDIEDGEE